MRFEDVYTFACLVLFNGTPAPRRGETRTFSILVPMDTLFEEYIGITIRKHAAALGLLSQQIHLQAKRRHLLKGADGRKAYGLKPDVLITSPSDNGRALAVLDTKWKRLRGGLPPDADIYQLYAYATRYEPPLAVLLYPGEPTAWTRDFLLEASPMSIVRVAAVNLTRNLTACHDSLLQELGRALRVP